MRARMASEKMGLAPMSSARAPSFASASILPVWRIEVRCFLRNSKWSSSSSASLVKTSLALGSSLALAAMV